MYMYLVNNADGHFDNAKQTWKGQDSNNGKTDLGTYNGWLYNKSHTIGWALGGDMETHNVTLGTRTSKRRYRSRRWYGIYRR